MICILLKIKECGIRSVVRHIIVVVTGSLQDKGTNIKDFHLYNNADEMKTKSVFETAAFLFSEKEDVAVDVDIGYVGRSNNIIAVD